LAERVENLILPEILKPLRTLLHKTVNAYGRGDKLDAAMSLEDLRVPPSNRLEALAGDRQGQHSIRINKQWRLCFVFGKDGAEDVEISKHYE
jgi:proteic killer suppression protein